MSSAFVSWVASLLLAAAPPGRMPELESESAGRARYDAIADAIVGAVESSKETLVGGDMPRHRSAAVMAAVAYMESGIRLDVDTGAKRGRAGECGLWQLMPLGPGHCARLLADRNVNAREAYAMMLRSRRACVRAGDPLRDALTAYASGSCQSPSGKAASRARIDLATRWFRMRPPTPAPK